MKAKILFGSLTLMILVVSLGSVIAQSNYGSGDTIGDTSGSDGNSGHDSGYTDESTGVNSPDSRTNGCAACQETPKLVVDVNYEALEDLISTEEIVSPVAAGAGASTPGYLISAVENVKKDFIKDLVDTLQETGKINTVNFYVVQFNVEINSLKAEIRERISEENLAVEVVSELAKRKLSEIIETEAVGLEPTKQEVEQELKTAEEKVSAEVSNAEIAEASTELENAPREFRAKVFSTLKAGSDELKLKVLEQFKQSIRIQTRTKVKNFIDLREENIETIRSLLDGDAQLSEIVDAVGA